MEYYHAKYQHALAAPGGASPASRNQFIHFGVHFHQKAPMSDTGAPPTGLGLLNGKSWIRPGHVTIVKINVNVIPSIDHLLLIL